MTDEQIKKLWERCGLKPIRRENSGEIVRWELPNGSWRFLPPDITLENLFKWAVPQAINELIMTGIGTRTSWEKLFVWWLDFYFQGIKIEDALFQAINQVIEEREEQ